MRGQPFVGQAGQLLDRILTAAGLLDLSLPVGFEVPDPSRASEADDEDGTLPLDDEAPEFAQDFVGERS